jgi:hypothetical protein
VGDVRLCRSFADDELGGYLGVGEPAGDEDDDLALAWGEVKESEW